MSTSSVVFDLPTLVQFGWSPSEMKTLCPAADIIDRSPIHVEAPVSLLSRVRPSMASGNFESFRWFMTPNRQLDSSSVISNITISVMSESEDERSVFSEGIVRSVLGTSSVERECYRLSISINGFRQYSVSRSSTVVFDTIRVTRHVFHELLLPLVERVEEIDVVVTDAFCNCLVKNIAKLGFFVPVLFFLLEANNSAIQSLMAHALSAVNSDLKNYSDSPSMWSFWSKKVDAPTLEDDEKFIKSYSHRFPRKPTPFSVFTQCKADFEVSCDLQISVSRLAGVLEKEEVLINTILSSIDNDLRSILSISPSFIVEEKRRITLSKEAEKSTEMNGNTVVEVDDNVYGNLELPQHVQMSSLLEMIRCPSRYMVLYSQASLSLVRQLPTISRQIIRSSGPKSSALQAVLNSLDDTFAEQVEFANQKRRHEMQQLCVLILCLIRHLGCA